MLIQYEPSNVMIAFQYYDSLANASPGIRTGSSSYCKSTVQLPLIECSCFVLLGSPGTSNLFHQLGSPATCCHLQFFFNLADFQPSPALTCCSICILVAAVAAEHHHSIFSCSPQCIVLKARLVLHTCGCHQPLAECLLWQNAP
jgi:hypothetical protein